MSRVLFAILIALLSVSAVADFDETVVREKEMVRRAPRRPAITTPAEKPASSSSEPRQALPPVLRI